MSIVMVLFWIASGLFTADVLLGKIGVMSGGAVHHFFGDVPHFLLLALAAALLTAECLRCEARRKMAHTSAASSIDSQSPRNQ